MINMIIIALLCIVIVAEGITIGVVLRFMEGVYDKVDYIWIYIKSRIRGEVEND